MLHHFMMMNIQTWNSTLDFWTVSNLSQALMFARFQRLWAFHLWRGFWRKLIWDWMPIFKTFHIWFQHWYWRNFFDLLSGIETESEFNSIHNLNGLCQTVKQILLELYVLRSSDKACNLQTIMICIFTCLHIWHPFESYTLTELCYTRRFET